MDSSMIVNKKILLLAPSFYNYYSHIKKEMEKSGASVDLILEVHDPLYLYFIRKHARMKEKYTYAYYKKEIEKINHDIDIIVLIRGEAISKKIMEMLEHKFPKVQKIMYQWDSIRNIPNALKIAPYFDYCYTFDPVDAEEQNWGYRPLFFINSNQTGQIKKKYDFVFIATLYYRRAQILLEMKEFCKKNGYSFFHHLFVKKMEYIIHKYLLRDRRYSVLNKSDVRFESLSQSKVEELYQQSRIFVDYTVEGQNGLSMRTIESIGNHSKIITNNKGVMNEDFFSPNNVFVYDIGKFDIPKEFIESEYQDLDEALYKKYSLSGWVEDILQGVVNEC